MKTKIVKILFIAFSFLILSKAIAEPFNFDDKITDNIFNEINSFSWTFSQKYDFIEDIKIKLSNIETDKKTDILTKINDLENDFKLKNIRKYVLNKYFSDTEKKLNLNFFRRWYQVLSRVDIQSDIHPNYLLKLENIIKEKKILDENDNRFKSYVFLVANLRKTKNYKRTEDILWNLDNLEQRQNFLNNSWSYEKDFDKLAISEWINLFSSSDFEKIKSKISDEKISPNSVYFQGFVYWYYKSEEIIKSSKIILENNIPHEIQTKKLSCEANSTTDFINYLGNKNSLASIDEQNIIDLIPTSGTGMIWGTGSDLSWWDPTKYFVWDMEWKQSRNPAKLSWYWIYADPLVNIINYKVADFWVKVQKNTFDEKNILKSLQSGSPIMSWYLLPVNIWSSIWYNFNPVSWKTTDWKVVNWYIWEHTWIIIWASLRQDWSINNLYYYEWKQKDLKVTNFSEIEKTAKLFNEIIQVKNT